VIDSDAIRSNFDKVQARIAAAAQRAGRDPGQIHLVAVAKGHPAEAIQVLVDLGVIDIGESYAEEGRAKQMAMSSSTAVKWHMIGHVQSRKAHLVATFFDLVHSVDSLKLAQRLDRFAAEAGRVLLILLECNVSAEVSKTGWPVSRDAERDAFYADTKEIMRMPNLKVQGLMSVAAVADSPEMARPHFLKTRQLRNTMAARFPQTEWKELSMGMSGDFEAAIAEGATLVRIGTAILGPRSK
jgi:hypothetical protein